MDHKTALSKLTSSSDFELLKKIVFPKADRLDWHAEYSDKPGVTFSDQDFHVRLGFLQIYWTEKMIFQLRSRFAKLNKLTQEFDFELTSTSDFDYEPNERIWEPRVTFSMVPKVHPEMDPAGGYGLASHV